MSRREAWGAYYFSVEIQGCASYFRSVSGLSSETDIQELQEGGLNSTTHKLLGFTKFPNIVLKEGLAGPELFNLRKKFISDGGGITRFNGTITQLGPGGPKAKWQFEKAWVCKWQGPEFDATKNEISIETIEIAHEGLTQIL